MNVTVFLLLLFSLLSYTANSFAFPVLRKTVIDPYYAQNRSETAEAVLERLEHPEEEQEDDTLPEYVYENGRMVHRSVIENAAVFDDRGREKD